MHVYLSPLAAPAKHWDAYRPSIADALAELGQGYGMVDLRPDPDGEAGWCLVGCDVALPSRLTAGVVYLGDDPDDRGTASRAALNSRLGVTLPMGRTLRHLVRELLIVEADDRSSGQRTKWGQLRPAGNRYVVALGGRQWDTWASVRGGATITDNFNRSDANPPGAPWTEQSGSDFAIVSNRLHFGGGSAGYLIHNTDLDGDDTYAEADGEWDSTTQFCQWGVQVRMDGSAGGRGYMMFLERGSGSLPAERANGFRIRRTSAANARTDVATRTTDIYQTWHGRIEISGSSLTATYTPTGQSAETLQATDSTYDEGLQVGVYNNAQVWWDNFDAGDLVSAPDPVELDGAAEVLATATGSIVVSRHPSGAAQAAHDSAGAVAIARSLEGTATAAATAAADVVPTRSVEGAAEVAATASGALTAARHVTGQADAAADASGLLVAERSLDGAAASMSQVVGSIAIERDLAGTAPTVATADGALVADRLLTGAAVSAVGAGAVLEAGRALTGQADAAFEATGNLVVERPLEGAAPVVARAAGTLSTASERTGTAEVVVAASGSLTVERQLEGHAASVAAADGTVTAGRRLEGTAHVVASASGEIEVAPQGVTFTGTARCVVRAHGSATVARPLTAASQSVVHASGQVAIARDLAGTATTATSGHGRLTVPRRFAGRCRSASRATGSAVVARPFGGTARIVTAQQGSLTVERLLTGHAEAVVDASGDVRIVVFPPLDPTRRTVAEWQQGSRAATATFPGGSRHAEAELAHSSTTGSWST